MKYEFYYESCMNSLPDSSSCLVTVGNGDSKMARFEKVIITHFDSESIFINTYMRYRIKYNIIMTIINKPHHEAIAKYRSIMAEC